MVYIGYLHWQWCTWGGLRWLSWQHGTVVNAAARIESVCHGGQSGVSDVTDKRPRM